MQEEEKIYGVSITKQELAELPIIRYQGRIVTVDSESDVQAALDDLRCADIVGFDTETKPNFKKGQLNKVALIQLATRECCYLFRLSVMGFPEILADFLEDETVFKIGLSLHDDFHNLSRLRPIEPAGFVDLQQYVKKFDIVDNSLSRIYGILFGERISKSQQLSNWEGETLSDAQKMYASLDAKACISIYDCLASGNFVPEKSKYYKEIVRC